MPIGFVASLLGKVWKAAAGGGSAPSVISAEQADVAGGDVSIVTVDDSTGITDMQVQGVSVPFFVVSATKVAIITPVNSTGLYDVSATNTFGTGTGSNILFYFDGNDANTTLRLGRGQYVEGTWTDESASGYDFASTTGPAETNKEPEFNPATDDLSNASATSTTLLGTTTAAGDTWSLSVMLRIKSTGEASPANTYDGNLVIGDTGQYVGIYYSDSWIRAYVFHGADLYAEVTGAPTLNEWIVVDAECNDGSLRIRVNGGAWSSPTALGGGPSNLASKWAMGTWVAHPGDIDVRGIDVSNVARGDTWFDQNLERWRVRHGFESTAGEPEVDEASPDVFDPAGGGLLFLKGRNFGTLSDVRIGANACSNVKAFAAMPAFGGVADLTMGLPLSTLIGATPTAFSIAALIYIDDLDSDVGNDGNAAVIGELGGYWRLHVSSNGARLSVWSGGGDKNTAFVPLPKKKWVALRAKWDGTKIYCAVDNVPFDAGVTSGGPDSVSGNVFLGRSHTTSHFLKGIIAEVLVSATEFDDATFTNIIGGWNFDYGLKISDVGAASFDRATLALEAFYKPGDYTSGDWAATASAGGSGGRDATTATAAPRVSAGEYAVATVPAKSVGTYPLVLVNGSGVCALTDAIEYFDPVSTTPAEFYSRPHYSTDGGSPETGTWIASAGSDVAITGPPSPPTAVGGAPDGEDGVTTFLQNAAVPLATWCGVGEHHFYANVVAEGLSGGTYYDGHTIFMDDGEYIALLVYKASGTIGVDAVFHASFWDYDTTDHGAAEVSLVGVVDVNGNSSGPFTFQGKKEGGTLYVRVNDEDWVTGPSGVGDTNASAGFLQVCGGTWNKEWNGKVLAAGTWTRALTPNESRRISKWSPP